MTIEADQLVKTGLKNIRNLDMMMKTTTTLVAVKTTHQEVI